jgi:hypothetical protein
MSRRTLSYSRCPPGVFCIENLTLLIFVTIIAVVSIAYLYYNSNSYSAAKKIKVVNEHELILQNSHDSSSASDGGRGLYPRPTYSFSNIENDVLLNPYKEPVRDDRYLLNGGVNSRDPRYLPINIQTQGVGINTEYRQVGILTKGDTILPLMGRPLFSNRDKWNFYTMNDKSNMIKLPMKFNNKSCSSEQGCDNIYNGDQVFVEGYGANFKATVYDNNVMRYLPFI